MSPKPISRSADLLRLRSDGYDIDVQSGYLVVRGVPYVNERKEVKRGTLVAPLTLADDVTVQPADHVAMFAGEYPCHADGTPIGAFGLEHGEAIYRSRPGNIKNLTDILETDIGPSGSTQDATAMRSFRHRSITEESRAIVSACW